MFRPKIFTLLLGGIRLSSNCIFCIWLLWESVMGRNFVFKLLNLTKLAAPQAEILIRSVSREEIASVRDESLDKVVGLDGNIVEE